MQTLPVDQIAAAGAERKPAFNVPWRPALMAYASAYTAAATQTAHVEPCMLAAIVDRETGGRNIFQIGMARGPGCGVGVCQITSGVVWTNPAAPTYGGLQLLDPPANVLVAARFFLEPALDEFPNNHVAAFAAYNLGGGGVQAELQAHEDPDTNTTGHDYGSSVFESWINFTAASLGVAVDWSSWKP